MEKPFRNPLYIYRILTEVTDYFLITVIMMKRPRQIVISLKCFKNEFKTSSSDVVSFSMRSFLKCKVVLAPTYTVF